MVHRGRWPQPVYRASGGLIVDDRQPNRRRSAWVAGVGSVIAGANRAIDRVFVAGLRYYRANRGSGATVVDVSTFFRNKHGRHKEFEAFWRRSDNTSRRGFTKQWKLVQRAIKEVDE